MAEQVWKGRGDENEKEMKRKKERMRTYPKWRSGTADGGADCAWCGAVLGAAVRDGVEVAGRRRSAQGERDGRWGGDGGRERGKEKGRARERKEEREIEGDDRVRRERERYGGF